MTGTAGRLRLRWRTTALAVCCIAGSTVAALQAPPAQAVEAGSLSAATTSSWQANATVWKLAYGHGDIWMVGDFTSLRPPGKPLGKDGQSAKYFAALRASTGAPDPAFDRAHHTFKGQPAGDLPLTGGSVAVSPNGATVYVGGLFTKVDGEIRHHIAAFSTATGALLPWNPNVNGRVDAIATHGSDVYIGGGFSLVDGTEQNNLAVLSATDGEPLSWGSTPPSTDATVDALAVSADGTQVLAGGYFAQADGLSKSGDGKTTYNKALRIGGLAGTDPGALEALPADSVVPPGTDTDNNGCTSDVKDVVIAGAVGYFANEGTGRGCFDGTWAVNLSNGTLRWVNRCLGATQALAVIGNYLYKGSHAHDCRTTNHNGDPANFPQSTPRHLLSEHLNNGYLGPWYPTTNAGVNLGPRTMATDGHQLYVGGDFTKVNGVGQQAIARFTTSNNYPTPVPAAPKVTSAHGIVTIKATPPVDLDDPSLRMELFRNGAAKPIDTTVVQSLFWRRPTVHWSDSHATPGETYTYAVRAVPTSGSPGSARSYPAAVTVACSRSHETPGAISAVKVARAAGHRRVQIRVCAARTMRVVFQARRHGKVLSSRVLAHLGAGDRVASLSIKNSVSRGAIRARVVFSRSSYRKVAVRKVYLPRTARSPSLTGP